MKKHRNPVARLAIVAAILSAGAGDAVVIDWAFVGDPGNPSDVNGYGSVAYAYQISKYEVTNSQYAEFLNAVAKTDTFALYNPNMGSNARGGILRSGVSGSFSYTVKPDMGDKPVNYVSWFDAARFTNWLHNSQPTGLQTMATTEGGAYTLMADSGLVTRNFGENGATIWIPTENEWYKAAYYDPTAAGTGNYWQYPTQSDSIPTVGTAGVNGDISNPGANVANYLSGSDWNSQNGNLTTVGSGASQSYYGTFDQGGNVWEWNDAIIGSSRGLRGGAYFSSESQLAGSFRFDNLPSTAGSGVGFRVASVPEPGVPVLAVFANWLLLRRRRS